VPERPNGTVSKTVVGVCLPWVQIPPLPPFHLTGTSEAHLDRDSRHAVIEKYLGALQDVGELSVDGVTLRDALRSGSTDLWSASSVRESSLWNDPRFFARLDMLQDSLDARGASTAIAIGLVHRVADSVRVIGAWARALVDALQRQHPSVHAEVMFVEYLPETYQVAQSGHSHYFGALPSTLRGQGNSVGYLHIHSDGPITRPTSAVRAKLRELNGDADKHVLLADFLTVGVWRNAFRTWWKLRRTAPRISVIASGIPPHSDARRLWPTWRAMYEQSVRGTHSVRTCLLAAMFDAAISRQPSTKLWVSAFEGQSWEACLARSLQYHGKRWLPYVHTMMRPWDLRARTLLQEVPPITLAVHGSHDCDELAPSGVPLVEVEALRYQQLASVQAQPDEANPSLQPRHWLIVGGAECERSNQELQQFLQALIVSGMQRQVLVKWHPQCGVPSRKLPAQVSLTTERLASLAARVGAALLVGSAAPLDTYLSGVPSCALRTQSGYSMSPIEDDVHFHTATDAADAVRWMQQAEHFVGFSAPVGDYFILDTHLPRWMALMERELSC